MLGHRLNNFFRNSGGSGSPAALPSGALGIWNPANFVSATKTIPNDVTVANPRSANMLRAPRGYFANTGLLIYGPNNVATVTDNNATAPDGSNEATTVIGGAGADWYVQCSNAKSGANQILNGVQYTLAISVKSLSGGSLNFKMGYGGGLTLKTATTVWQRFSVTFVFPFTSGTASLFFESPDTIAAANFAICDFELFAGAADLNVNALIAKPQILQNRDITLSFDGSAVTGGKLIGGALSVLQLESSLDVKNYTIIYVAKKNLAYVAGAQFEPVLSQAEDGSETWTNFSVGPVINSNAGQFITNNSVDRIDNGQSAAGVTTLTAELFGLSGAGPFVAAHRFSGGNHSSAFINGIRIADYTYAAPLTPNTVKDFNVGFLIGSGFQTTYDLYYLVLYPRVLSDAEIQAATTYFATKVTLGTSRTVLFLGSSITASVGGAISYVYQGGPNYSPKVFGANWAFPGNSLVNVLAQESFIDDAFNNSPAQTKIVIFEIGANDLNTAPANIPAFLSSYASLCDRQRAKGRKVVVTTVLNRQDAQGTANYIANRGTVNPVFRTWIGVHCDALADWASDPTMGTDAAPSNATNFQDLVHPTTAGYTLLEPYSRIAINSL